MTHHRQSNFNKQNDLNQMFEVLFVLFSIFLPKSKASCTVFDASVILALKSVFGNLTLLLGHKKFTAGWPPKIYHIILGIFGGIFHEN